MKTYGQRRFWARTIDGALLCFPFLFGMVQVAEAVERGLADSTAGSLVLSILGTASALIIEPILISKYGFTPGKWVMSLRVLKKDGTLLTHREALTRTFHAVAQGLGFSIRGVVFIALGYQCYKLWKDKESSWDAALDTACLLETDFASNDVIVNYTAQDVEAELETIAAEEAQFEAEPLENEEAEEAVVEEELADVVDISASATEIPQGEESESLALELDLNEEKAA